jgi:amino acid transporter
LLATLAVSRAIFHRQIAWHGWLWVIVALVFIALALVQVCAVEEWMSADVRSMLRKGGVYKDRGYIQKPLMAVLLLIALALAAGLVCFIAKGAGRRGDIAAIGGLGCTGAMILLAAIRLVSLHSTDALLFGPLRLNWCIDFGLSFAVLACALRYLAVMHRTTG